MAELNLNPVGPGERVDSAAIGANFDMVEAELANRVNRSGDTMTGPITIPSATIKGGSQYTNLNFQDGNGNTKAQLVVDNNTGELYLKATGTGMSKDLIVNRDGRLLWDYSRVWYGGESALPSTDNAIDIGAGSLRIRNIYAGTGTINTSDERKKKDISILDEIKDFFMSLNPVKFRLKDGTSGRIHHGLIAQEVEAAMTKNRIPDMDFAGLIKSPDEEKYGECIYGLRYSEFIPMLIKMVQDQQREIDALKAR